MVLKQAKFVGVTVTNDRILVLLHAIVSLTYLRSQLRLRLVFNAALCLLSQLGQHWLGDDLRFRFTEFAPIHIPNTTSLPIYSNR